MLKHHQQRHSPAYLRGGADFIIGRVRVASRAMGKLVRRTLEGDEVVAEWSADDAGLGSARRPRRCAARSTLATRRCSGGEGRNEPVDELPPDADVVILTMAHGRAAS